MPTILVTSKEPRVGRSVVAAAIAYREARAGKRVALARIGGDDGAERDARAFAALEYMQSPGAPVTATDAAKLAADVELVVLEAPAGDAPAIDGAQLVDVARFPERAAVVTAAPVAESDTIAARNGVAAVLVEDRTLAAPAVEDVAQALHGRWIVETESKGSIDRVMIGTVASDAASPYFGNRERKCVITRFDKTDIQLAALLTDLELLVLTGGGEPSPYLVDRVQSAREDIGVLLVDADSVDAMHTIEPLYGRSPFDGAGKMMRAVEMLDAQEAALEFA
jgi:BioD-like phosphotransacetylase family protein